MTYGKKKIVDNDVRTRLRAHMLAGGNSKSFSIDQGWHETTAGKMLESMGFTKMFVTTEEREMLMKLRKVSK